MTRLFLQLNRTGSGEITINQNDPAAPDFAFGKFIRIIYRGEDRGGFFVDNIDQVDASEGEEGERNVNIKGRGMLGILDNIIVAHVSQGETTVYYTAKKIGYILDDLLSLGLARGVYPNLIWDFTAIADSETETWTVNHDLGFRVGSTLLQAIGQFAELGVDFKMSYNPGADQYVLSAFKDGIGSDRSASVVFSPGNNVLKASKLQEGSGIRNAQLIEVADLTSGPKFVWDTRAGSITTYGRREVYFQAGNASTITEGLLLAAAELDEKADPRVQYSLVVSDANGPTVFEDYDIGDTVGYLNSEGTIDLVQVISLQLDFTKDQYYADVTIGLGVLIIDTEITSALKLKQIAPGVTGIGGGPSDPAVVAGALIGIHNADITAHSPYLRDANKIQGFDIVDPGTDTPTDDDLMQYSTVNARWDYVTYAEAGLDARYVEIAGDTMVGTLLMSGATAIQFRSAAAFIYSGGAGYLTLVASNQVLFTTPSIQIGRNVAEDLIFDFNSFTNDGILTWKDTEDYFLFGDDIVITGNLFIDGGADEIQLLVQANATQTVNTLEVQKSDGTEIFVVDTTNGRVGINTDSPDAAFHVSGGDVLLDNNQSIRFKDSGGTLRTAVKYRSDDNVVFGGGVGSGSDIYIKGGNVFIIKSDDDIGIGTATPGARLHIKGSIDDQQLIVQANSTQTANIFEAQKSDTTLISGIDAEGRLFSYGGSGIATNAFYNGGGNSTLSGTNNFAFYSGSGSLLTSGTDNILIGRDTGGVITGNSFNIYIGALAGRLNTGGTNTIIGSVAFSAAGAGDENAGVGYRVLGTITSGVKNSALGKDSLRRITTGDENVAVGYNAGQRMVGGSNNVLVGVEAGQRLTSGSGNIFIGYYAGDWQTTNSNRFIVDNQERTSTGDSFMDAILWGIMDAVPANQQIWINAATEINDSLIVDGSVDTVQLTVQAHSTQNVNIVEIQDDGGNVDISFLDGGAVFNEQLNDVDHVIGGNTEPNLLVVDAGAEEVRLGDWDTNYFTTDKNGDSWWVGGGGLLFGEISSYDVNATISITGTGIGNKAQIMVFDTNGGSNGMTPDHTNDHITVLTAGWYFCSVSITINSLSGSAAQFGFGVYKNDGGVLFTNVHRHRDLPSGAGDHAGSVSISGMIDLAVNDTIEVWVWNEDNTQNIVVDDITLTLIQFGGT